MELIRYEWHSVLRQHPQTKNLRYVSERREIPVRTDRVVLGAEPVEYVYTAPRSGDYALRVGQGRATPGTTSWSSIRTAGEHRT